jgi:hypothetical protein
MYSDSLLTTHLQTSSVIQSKSKILAEWNLNIVENIDTIGNYFYRPDTSGPNYNSIYATLPTTWSTTPETSSTINPQYYGGTNYDVVIDGGYDYTGTIPLTFTKQDEQQKALMSLEDCFKRFRPRSGINKLRYFNNKKTTPSNTNMYQRPRYYIAGANDIFKYWSSYRKTGTFNANNTEKVVGISYAPNNKIEDVAPFVVYKNQIPTNRVVIKVQTNVGDGQLLDSNNVAIVQKDSTGATIEDPFYSGSTINYKSTPLVWTLEKYDGTAWTQIYTTSSDVFTTSDGYLELAYGLNNSEILTTYKDNFNFIGYLANTASLPALTSAQKGYGYIVQTNSTAKGSLYIWTGSAWTSAITPTYGWYVNSSTVNNSQPFISELTLKNSSYYTENNITTYRQFQYIKGLRVSVTQMKNPDTSFDLIELSPRLIADISDMTIGYSVKKIASDIGVSSFPVGQLLASSGSLQIFDYAQVFNQNNTNSLLNIYDSGKTQLQFTFASKNLQLKIYEKISQVPQGGGNYKDYTIPIKTMYLDGYPQYDNTTREISFNLRDFYFYFESITAPQIMMQNAPLSAIIATLLDNIGFSNYMFKRTTINGAPESDPIIPYFFVAPNKTIIQVLNDLAQATQTAMFFDEDNNFVCMSKGFLIPDSTSTRLTDTSSILTLLGNDSGNNKANILDIKSVNNDIYNDGKIVYRNRYIQKEIASLSQASNLDKDRVWRYKPVLLWEVSGEETTKSINEQTNTSSNYTLSAAPLNTTLTSDIPAVSNPSGVVTIINSTIDIGDSVYYMSRYNGYLYANGEIIKYDAIEYNITGSGNKWITSTEEYQRYFASLPFGGQMYPTGNVRIYAEPYYNTDGTYKLGPVIKHGRGQFGTTITNHYVGLDQDEDWSKDSVKIVSDWQVLFNNTYNYSTLSTIESNYSAIVAQKPKVSTKIKNFLGEAKYNSVTKKYDITDMLQASALIFTGPNFTFSNNGLSAINLLKKDLSGTQTNYDTYGTRLRIIGTQKVNSPLQSPSGANSLYTVTTVDGISNSISGSSGGMCINTLSDGTGYYYEIVALSNSGTTGLTATSKAGIYNIFFYRLDNYEYKKTVNVPISTTTGGGIKTVTGLEKAVVGTRVWLSNQTIISQNGYYVVSRAGSGSDGYMLVNVNSLKPILLYQGYTQILVDDGLFTGQSRSSTDTNPTVYDLSIQSNPSLNKDGSKTFSLYLNNSLVATVNDPQPLSKITQNVGAFIRGSSNIMFENIYALQSVDFAKKSSTYQNANSIFTSSDTNMNMNKSALSGILQSTYLNSISSASAASKSLYYDEFGTIMREMSYFNVKFDKAYPTLYSTIAPTFSNNKGFLVSGYTPNAYGAEFLLFNTTDSILSLDSTSGNYLRILGISFTQESVHDLTVDEYYSKLSDPSTSTGIKGKTPDTYKKEYTDIKNSRINYGVKSFTVDSTYIQNYTSAKSLMDWIIPKISKPRLSVGIDVFGLPILQLGDIVKINYTSSSINQINSPTSNFVVYSIEYSKNTKGPSMLVYLSEVV